MYLKVQIPYLYSLSKSIADPTVWDVLPHKASMTHGSSSDHHLFCDLSSYQTPWSQLNKKGEIYDIDNVRTLYPAFRKTSKIRPKMLPSSGRVGLFNLNNLGSLIRYGPPRKYDDVTDMGSARWDGVSNSEAETVYAANLKTFAGDIYRKVYQPFFETRTKPLAKFMDWVGTQKDMVGVWNSNTFDSHRLAAMGNIHYEYRVPPDNGVSVLPLLTRTRQQSQDASDISTKLEISYDQRMWASVPYESYPDFSQPRQPVPILYSYESDIQELKTKLAHKEVSSWRRSRPKNQDFNPPILDWESVGFPKVAPVSTKALYSRQPIHLQFTYLESGFVDKDAVTQDKGMGRDNFFQDVMDESADYLGWFRNLALPIDTGAKRVSNARMVQGMIRSVSDMSENKADFYHDGEIIGRTLHYQSTGNAYVFQIESGFTKSVSRQIHFPTGVVNQSQSGPDWETIPLNPMKTKSLHGNYYGDSEKLYPVKKATGGLDTVTLHPYDRRLQNKHLKATSQTPAVIFDTNSPLQGDLPHLDIDKSVTYPRLTYKANTCAYSSYSIEGGRGARTDQRFVFRRPANIPSRLKEEEEGMRILHRILNQYLIPNEYEFGNSGHSIADVQRHSGMTPPKLLSLIDATQSEVYDIRVTKIPVKSGEAVRLTQNFSLQYDNLVDLEKAFQDPNNALNTLSEGEKDVLRAYCKVTEETPLSAIYSVIFYINPQNDLSVLVSYPSFLMRDGGRAARDLLLPALMNMELRAIFQNKEMEVIKHLFVSQKPIIILQELDRYNSSGKGVIQLCSDGQYDAEVTKGNPVEQKWDSSYFTKSFSDKTVFNDYCYDLLHIKSGITLSDPVNTLPFDLKRNKLIVKRPFSYTSLFPVAGKKVDFKITTVKTGGLLSADGNERTTIRFDYSPVTSYDVPQTPSEELPDNTPMKIFKPMTTNARTFKAQRRDHADMLKAADYTTYSSIVLPFEHISLELLSGGNHTSIRQAGTSRNIASASYKPLDHLGQLQMDLDAKQDKTLLLMPYAKDQRIQDARSEGKRSKFLSNNLAEWSLGVPTAFVPETYSLTGRELGIFNWPFGLE